MTRVLLASNIDRLGEDAAERYDGAYVEYNQQVTGSFTLLRF